MSTEKRWKIATFNAPTVHEVSKGSRTALTENNLAKTLADPRDSQRWWIAVSIAAALFGDKGSLDPNKNISGQTGNPANASGIAMYTNTQAQALCTTLSFRWDGVTTQEIQGCSVVHAFTDLVMENIV